MNKILLTSVLSVLSIAFFSLNSFSITRNKVLSPEDIISPSQQANYFEKYLGVMEVGKTKRQLLELYTGEGYVSKKSTGYEIYYFDKKNNRTLIVEVNHQDIIEVAEIRAGLSLPTGIKNINQIKDSKKINLKNVMTSMGSRMGYSSSRIMSAYGKPSVEIKDKDKREFKYIMLGNLNPKLNFVYLEYSFIFVKNKVVSIRIENGK